MTKTQTKTILSAKSFLESAYDCGKLGGLTPHEVYEMAFHYNEIVKSAEHFAETISKNVASKFKKLGFKVCATETENTFLHWHISLF